MSRRAATLAVASVLILVLALAGSQMPVPYVELRPGPTSNTLGTNEKGEPLIKIEGRRTYPDQGHLNFTTVTYRGGPGARLDLFSALQGWLDDDVAVVPEETIFPENESQEQVDQENTRQMEASQQSAEAAALNQLGIKFPVRVLVDSVQKGLPADGRLRPGDEVVAMDGTPVTKLEDVTGRMEGRKPGGQVTITYKRSGKEEKAVLKTVASPDGGTDRPVMGVVLRDEYVFPFKINISVGDVGGPSAGLMFSLAIVDKLTPGSLPGRTFVAGTGTITPAGEVGAIGGIQQKMVAARRAGATVFLTPADNCADAAKARPDGLRLVRADTLKTAIDALNNINAGKGDVPTCS
ncbi:PDZ domain-containing protein [Spirillospora sp. NPDC029432]|uniref:YlbL family protein n=1 Tax=Spirillospora sp. NPDC029432 TaxID=3154599 RepID=UPI0034552680